MSSREPGKVTSAYATRISKHILDKVPGLYCGFDARIEASGAEEYMQIGIKLCRPGETCKLSHSLTSSMTG